MKTNRLSITVLLGLGFTLAILMFLQIEIPAVRAELNTPPVATDDDYSTPEETAISGNVISDDTGNGVDSDANSDPLASRLVTGVPTGSLELLSNGTFTYTPPFKYNGSITFTYLLTDGNAAPTGEFDAGDAESMICILPPLKPVGVRCLIKLTVLSSQIHPGRCFSHPLLPLGHLSQGDV